MYGRSNKEICINPFRNTEFRLRELFGVPCTCVFLNPPSDQSGMDESGIKEQPPQPIVSTNPGISPNHSQHLFSSPLVSLHLWKSSDKMPPS